MRLPWTIRLHIARNSADAAEAELRRAHQQRREAQEMADEARAIRERNGFAEAIRLAMGVSRDDR